MVMLVKYVTQQKIFNGQAKIIGGGSISVMNSSNKLHSLQNSNNILLKFLNDVMDLKGQAYQSAPHAHGSASGSLFDPV